MQRQPVARRSASSTRSNPADADGHQYRFSGINMYNANSDGGMAVSSVTSSWPTTSTRSVRVTRSSIRAWFFQSLAAASATSPGRSSGARDWTRMDRTLAIAAAHHVHIIATLTDHDGECSSSVNHARPRPSINRYQWPDPEESSQYDHWVPYYDWTTEIVSRYANNDTILYWRLINEAEVVLRHLPLPARDWPGRHPARLGRRCLNHVRSLDSNHLVAWARSAPGDAAPARRRVQAHAQPAERRPVQGASVRRRHADTGSPIQRHATRIDACRQLNKPLFVGEFEIEPNQYGWTCSNAP